MLGEKIREKGFWLQDALQGGIVRKHYLDIKRQLEDKDAYCNEQALESLLKHAMKTTEYYNQFGEKIKFEDFPIIDKNFIKANYDKLISKQYRDKKNHKMSTSGSTGTPFTIIQDTSKRKRVLAELIYFGEKAGYVIGDRYIFTRIWTEKNRKSKLELMKQNLVECDLAKLDNENLGRLTKLLKGDKKIKYILGYANTLDVLSKYVDQKGEDPDDFNLKIIISGSEKLEVNTKERLKRVFGCNVVSRYSNQENGILAQQCIEADEFHLNTASYYFEFLKLDSDEPAQIGELARIVVTDLYNYAFPIIRYDTGDICTLKQQQECKWQAPVIYQIEGRRVDLIYNVEDCLISPHLVTNNFWRYSKLKQYQFIQEDKAKYKVKVNGAEGKYSDEEIINTVVSIVGEGADISIEHVTQIPILKSGKYKKIICNYKPS